MNLCSYCGGENREGLLFCENCGNPLGDAAAQPTLPTRKLEDSLGEFSSRATWGSASITGISAITIHIRDASEPVTLEVVDQIVVGRADNSSPRQPDFDLTPFGALEKGVSRIHAAIERNDDVLTLIDMGSSNGTHLNGQRLLPDSPRVLRDGDEIRFGKLITHIYFT